MTPLPNRHLVAFAFLLFARGASAQSSSTAAAQTLFEDGRKLMTEGKYAQACPKLASSQRLDPGAGTLLNLAACYEKNGQTASAWATYTEAASASKQAGHADWETRARERAAALAPTLSRLTILVPPPSDVPGLAVERDGVKVDRGEWGAAIPVDPGVHTILTTAPKLQQWSTTISVGPNGAEVDVKIPPMTVEQTSSVAPAAAPPAPFSPFAQEKKEGPSPGSTQRILGISVAGLGVVSAAVGVVFALKAKSTYNDAVTHCTIDDRCTTAGVEGVDSARSQATTSTLTLILGAAAIAGGAVIYFTAPSAKPASGVAARFAPTPGGGVLALGGAW